jgi:hypothetical protein
VKRIHPKYICFSEDKDYVSCSYVYKVNGVFKDSFVFIKPKGTNQRWLPVPEGAHFKEYYIAMDNLNKCKTINGGGK